MVDDQEPNFSEDSGGDEAPQGVSHLHPFGNLAEEGHGRQISGGHEAAGQTRVKKICRLLRRIFTFFVSRDSAFWTTFTTALILVTTVIYTIYSRKQWGTMEAQLQEMKGSGAQTDQLICLYAQQVMQLSRQVSEMEKLSGHTQEQADQTKRSADAAKSAAETAREALLRSQRPWVGPEREPDIYWNQRNPDQSRISLAIKNFGPSPALHVGYWIGPYVQVNSVGEAEAISRRSCQLAEMASITSDHLADESFGFSLLPNAPGTVFGGLPWDPVKGYSMAIGCIAYTDEFHKKSINSPIHHTRFCYRSFTPLAPGHNSRLTACSFAEGMD